jgi:hypothetical protein
LKHLSQPFTVKSLTGLFFLKCMSKVISCASVLAGLSEIAPGFIQSI